MRVETCKGGEQFRVCPGLVLEKGYEKTLHEVDGCQ
jgi:hypothetical protein